jgi:hypothetical protein
MDTQGKSCNLSQPQRQAMMLAGGLVLVGLMLGFYVHPLFQLLPLLTGAGLVYAGISGTCYLTAWLDKGGAPKR